MKTLLTKRLLCLSAFRNYRFSLLAVVLGLLSCDASHSPRISTPKNPQQNDKPLQMDTAKMTILPFEVGRSDAFDDSYRPAEITQADIVLIEQLLDSVVLGYNKNLVANESYKKIDWEHGGYRQQLVAAVQKEGGDKVVWVNCFCRRFDARNWKIALAQVEDGGNCYFNLKINLTTRKVSDFRVNGES